LQVNNECNSSWILDRLGCSVAGSVTVGPDFGIAFTLLHFHSLFGLFTQICIIIWWTS